MTRRRQFVALVVVGVVLLLEAGCNKKKPQLPSQAKAPVDAVAVPLSNELSEEMPPPPPPAPPPPAPKAEEPKPQPARHRKRKPSQPPATTQSSPANPPASGNTTLATAHLPANPANEAPPDTAIAADVNSAQLVQQKQTTAQLLEATEKTLGGLPHGLSHDQEEMVMQIRTYVTQSRKATTDGDFERAYNLATKAHLLCDALVKK